MGLARWSTVFPESVVVVAAVPAAMCGWGLCSRCLGVGGVSRAYTNHQREVASHKDFGRTACLFAVSYR